MASAATYATVLIGDQTARGKIVCGDDFLTDDAVLADLVANWLISLDMETDQPTISNLAESAAEQADRLAAYLRENDARQMLSSVEDMARRQPLLFLGGAFVLGVATARIFKAGSSTPKPTATRSYSATRSGSRNGLEDYSSEVR